LFKHVMQKCSRQRSHSSNLSSGLSNCLLHLIQSHGSSSVCPSNRLNLLGLSKGDDGLELEFCLDVELDLELLLDILAVLLGLPEAIY
jgi:hypothetical protein